MDSPQAFPYEHGSRTHEPTILIVGMGDPMRGDDSAGQIVASEIRQQAPQFVRICEHAGDGTSLISLWEEASDVIVVDALVSGAPPGTIHRLDAIEQALPGWQFQVSTHAIGLAEAVELARITNRLPERLIIYGIEGRVFECGCDLSVEVRNALPIVIERVLDEVNATANAMRRNGRISG